MRHKNQDEVRHRRRPLRHRGHRLGDRRRQVLRERLLRVLVRDDLPQVRVEVLQPVYHCCRCMRQLPFAGRLQPSSADADPATFARDRHVGRTGECVPEERHVHTFQQL